jgi:rhodanese-related sulfurtransferase
MAGENGSEAGLPIEEWDGEHLLKALGQENPPRIVDVRTEGEFAQGSLPGAVNVPLDELDRRKDEAAPDAGCELVAVCSDGERSAVAVMILRSLGVPHVKMLHGGLRSVGIETDPEVE